jgi:ABC-type Fe3+/spermidine/putrescine transport system ATPase subunit
VPAAAEFRRVSRTFGGTRALDDLSLGIEEDALTAILGPSGCGKTTLLRILAGLDEPEEGEVLLGGRTVANPASTLRPEERGVALVFQDLALWPHMTVRENVAFPLEGRIPDPARRAARVAQAAEAAAIAHRLDARPATLSGGERQRVALARALAGEPRILLLDEPFGGLDAELRLRMVEAVAEVRARLRIAAVLVTHDRQEALGAADRVVVLRAGRVAQEGTPREIYGEPRSRWVASFTGLAAFLPGADLGGGRARTALGEIPFRGSSPGGDLLLAIRPEEMRLDPAGPFRGVAGRALFRGDGWIVPVGAAGGTRLLVRTAEPPERGAEVAFAVAAPPAAVPPAPAEGEEAP